MQASPTPDTSERFDGVRRVLLATLVLNVAVAGAKIAYGFATGALAIRADGFHSLTDSANNFVGLIAISLARRPPDAEHPYGHHKFEIVAASMVGVSLLVMAYDVTRTAVERLITGGGTRPKLDNVAFLVLGLTLIVNLIVAWWERKRGRELDSHFLLSDAAHTRSDVIVTIGVLSSVVLVTRGLLAADLIAALLVAGFIGWTAIDVLRKNLGSLVDRAIADPARIEELALEVPGVASVHKIRTRGATGSMYVDLHIQIPPHLDIVRAHRVTHAVIDAIKTGVPGVADVLIHTEPARPGQIPRHPLPDDAD